MLSTDPTASPYADRFVRRCDQCDAPTGPRFYHSGEFVLCADCKADELGLCFVSYELCEGQYVEVGCLRCRQDVTAVYDFATPAKMYVACIACPCGAQIVEFDALTDGAVRLTPQGWRPVQKPTEEVFCL